MVKVENVNKKFGSVEALKNISFTIESGEIVGFLGPNGAGKTTAMRIIAGYLSPDSGTVLINDKNIEEEPIEIKAEIGYLPEQPPLYQEMSVRDYLIFVARIKGTDKKDIFAFVQEAMAAVGIEDKAAKTIQSLSKGYKQRVGIAGALVHKPSLLLLDEPTVGLDPHQIIEIRKLISGLRDQKRTLIISTHILAEVEQVCDKVVIINNGEIVAVDTKEALIADAAGSRKIRLEVARDPQVVKDKVSSIDGVQVLSVDGNTLILSVTTGSDKREEIAGKVVGDGYGLLTMQLEGTALEDIFLKLTKENNSESKRGDK